MTFPLWMVDGSSNIELHLTFRSFLEANLYPFHPIPSVYYNKYLLSCAEVKHLDQNHSKIIHIFFSARNLMVQNSSFFSKGFLLRGTMEANEPDQSEYMIRKSKVPLRHHLLWRIRLKCRPAIVAN